MISYVKLLQKMAFGLGVFLGIACSYDANALTWKMPPDIFQPSGIQSLDFASDPVGNAFTVWDSTTGELFSSRFSALTETYGAPTLLDTIPTTETIRVAADATQTALIIWTDSNAGEIKTAYFDGSTYVTPTPSPLVSLGVFTFFEIAVDMDGTGKGVAVWINRTNFLDSFVLASFFDPGTQSWGPVLTVTGVLGNRSPDVAFSADGTAVAIWTDSFDNLFGSNFNGLTWSVPVPLATNAFQPEVGIDASGNALVVYQDLTTNDLFSTYYSSGSWIAPVLISTEDLFTDANFQMSPSGTAIVSFEIGDAGYYSYFSGGVWSAPIQFTPPGGDGLASTAVAIDTAGNALLTYTEFTNDSTYSRYLPFGGALQAEDFISSRFELTTEFAGLADNGRGFITGRIPLGEDVGASGTYTLFGIPIPPPVVSGSTCKDKFATQTDRVHIITFTPSPDLAVTDYLLRRNGVLIAVIPATGPFIYYDHNRCRKVEDVYSLTAVSPLGESPPAIVVLR